MWIDKKEYDRLQNRLRIAESRVTYFDEKFDSLRNNQDSVIMYGGCIITTYENFQELIKKECQDSDAFKELKAELEYYKVKYIEAKNNVNEVKCGTWILHDGGSATCDQCNIYQKNIYDYDNYQKYCGSCGAKMHLKTE